MNKLNISRIPKTVWLGMRKHSPEILTGVGIASMITTTVFAVKATPTALQLLEDAKREKGEPLTPPEKVKAAWKPYIPAAVTGVLGVTCLIGASSVNVRRTAALAAAYRVSETALTEYREAVVDTVGEKKEREIKEKAAQKRVDSVTVTEDQIINTGNGNTLFMDPWSNMVFRSSRNAVERAENVINKRILHDISGNATLNEFYDELGLPHTVPGEDLGWTTDNPLNVCLEPTVTNAGEPCLMVWHESKPRYDY